MIANGCFAIILNEKHEVLLCKRTDMDIWNLPGGRMELGESPDETVIREVKEEIGVDVSIDRLLGVHTKPHDIHVVFSFLCTITSGNIQTSDEVAESRFFALADMPRNILYNQADRLFALLHPLKEDIVYGCQNGVYGYQNGTSTRELLEKGILEQEVEKLIHNSLNKYC